MDKERCLGFTVTLKVYPDGRTDEHNYQVVTLSEDAYDMPSVLDVLERAIRAVGYDPAGMLGFIGEEEQ
jgi:hypothetical protein